MVSSCLRAISNISHKHHHEWVQLKRHSGALIVIVMRCDNEARVCECAALAL